MIRRFRGWGLSLSLRGLGRRKQWAPAWASLALVAACASAPEPDVYVAGFESNGHFDVATVWKNGAATSLTDGTGHAHATGVAVDGADVHVCGVGLVTTAVGQALAAALWKNGVAVPLRTTSPVSFASAVAVQGHDVYVAGTDGNVATVWKNGEPTALTTGLSDAQGIALSGADVYVVGSESIGRAVTPRVWKNGAATSLPQTFDLAGAAAVAVQGGSVFIAGNDGPYAIYWKDGVRVALTDGVFDAGARGIAFAAGRVLVAGTEGNGQDPVAKLWVDGLPNDLSFGSGGGGSEAIATVGGDVYVAGFTPTFAGYWKNGRLTPLTNGRSGANALAIAVVPR